jgi:hypothetical protein
MTDKLWGPINPENWNKIAHMSDKLATRKDVKEGRAVFFLENTDEIPAWPSDLKIPGLAIWKVEDEMKNQPAVIIQAEQSEFQCTVGVRFFAGGNGLCLLEDLELIEEKDLRFKELNNC